MPEVKLQARFQYRNRAERAKYIADVYTDFLTGDVLDVGCSGSALKGAVKGKYVGVDIAGTPDIVVDLEKSSLPFADNSFDCVVCSDVLEHLNNLHDVFDELARVSRRYVIISLPNSRNYEILLRIWSRRPLKFYGLPATKPSDRHKWFFGYDDARAFIRQNSKRLGLRVATLYPHPLRYKGPKGWLLLGIVRLLAVTRHRFDELGSMALWTLLEKAEQTEQQHES